MTRAITVRTVGVLAVIWAVAMPASAGLITLSGGFGQYVGPVGYPPGTPEFNGQGPSIFNGVQVDPDGPSARPGVGLVTHNFAPGTSSIDFYFGSQNHNLLQFTPAPEQDVQLGQEFLIGTFTIGNGNWFGGLSEGDPTFTFSVRTSSSDPMLDGHVFSDAIVFEITQSDPGNTPQQNADWFSFVGRPDLGTMSAYEIFDSPIGTNIGTIDFYGRIGSLIPTRFANAQGGAFIGAAAVPEAGIQALMLASLGWIVSRRRRK